MKFRNVILRYYRPDAGGGSGSLDTPPAEPEVDEPAAEPARVFETEEEFKKETQALIDKAVADFEKKQKAAHEKAIAEAVAEAQRKAKLSPEDLLSEEEKAKAKRLAELEAENLNLKLTKAATELLAKTTLPQELLNDSLNVLTPSMTDEETVKAAVSSLDALVKTSVEKAVKAERAKILDESDGDPGADGKHGEDAAVDAFINALSGTRNTKNSIFD